MMVSAGDARDLPVSLPKVCGQKTRCTRGCFAECCRRCISRTASAQHHCTITQWVFAAPRKSVACAVVWACGAGDVDAVLSYPACDCQLHAPCYQWAACSNPHSRLVRVVETMRCNAPTYTRLAVSFVAHNLCTPYGSSSTRCTMPLQDSRCAFRKGVHQLRANYRLPIQQHFLWLGASLCRMGRATSAAHTGSKLALAPCCIALWLVWCCCGAAGTATTYADGDTGSDNPVMLQPRPGQACGRRVSCRRRRGTPTMHTPNTPQLSRRHG